jgi:hypothetical protein
VSRRRRWCWTVARARLWLGVTAQKLAEMLPNGRRQTLEGQQHNVDPEALAPAVANFFRA